MRQDTVQPRAGTAPPAPPPRPFPEHLIGAKGPTADRSGTNQLTAPRNSLTAGAERESVQ